LVFFIVVASLDTSQSARRVSQKRAKLRKSGNKEKKHTGETRISKGDSIQRIMRNMLSKGEHMQENIGRIIWRVKESMTGNIIIAKEEEIEIDTKGVVNR